MEIIIISLFLTWIIRKRAEARGGVGRRERGAERGKKGMGGSGIGRGGGGDGWREERGGGGEIERRKRRGIKGMRRNECDKRTLREK